MEIKYCVFGASGHAKVVLDILFSNAVAVASIIDDNPKVTQLSNIPVIPSGNFNHSAQTQLIIAIGDNLIRKKIVDGNSFHYFKAIHVDASVSNFSSIGKGTVIMPKAVVNSGVSIGKHCIINSGSVVEHDCQLEDFVHISPNASLAGNVVVGEGAHIGIGATVIQGISIGKWATIGAGAVIINDVPDNVVVVGNPGKIIKS